MIVFGYDRSYYCALIWCWSIGESTHQHGSLDALFTSFNY